MPSYELVLLLKKMGTPDLKAVLKRTAESIWEIGGVLKRIDNMGFAPLPYKIKGVSGVYKEANRFLYSFHAGEEKIPELQNTLLREMTLVRQRVYCVADPLKISLKEKNHECDIYIDRLPVPDRPHVMKMVEIASQKRRRNPFNFGNDRNYYPLGK